MLGYGLDRSSKLRLAIVASFGGRRLRTDVHAGKELVEGTSHALLDEPLKRGEGRIPEPALNFGHVFPAIAGALANRFLREAAFFPQDSKPLPNSFREFAALSDHARRLSPERRGDQHPRIEAIFNAMNRGSIRLSPAESLIRRGTSSPSSMRGV